MPSKILKLGEIGVAAAVESCREALARPGAVLLIPTETVYGLVCRSSDAAAIDRIYRLKHRPSGKQLALFVSDWRMLAAEGVKLDGLPSALAEKYCPGPITIIAEGATGTVGFRIPDHPLVLRLLQSIDFPLASTSANASGSPNARSVAAALEQLDGDVDLALDGGTIPAGALASTVVDATGNRPKILRQGALTIEL